MIIIDPAPSQYHIQRVNPFKQLSETLQSLQLEGCDGSVLYLTCPTGTKVVKVTVLSNIKKYFPDFYPVCVLWKLKNKACLLSIPPNTRAGCSLFCPNLPAPGRG